MCTRSHISEEGVHDLVGVHEGENDIVVATDALTTLFNRHFLDNFVKRLLAILVCTLAALLCAAPASPALGEDGDALTVGVPVDRCPMFYQDASTGELVGIGVDLMRAAADEAGFSPTFRPISEPTLKEALDNGDYDVVMPFGSAIPSASGKETIVSESLIQTPFTLVTVGNEDLPPLESLKVGMLKSLAGGAETVGQLYPGVEIEMYDTMDDSVRALRAGEVDALLHNSYVWSYVLQKPAYSDLKVQPFTVFSMDFQAGAIDDADGRATIDRLNRGIAKLDDVSRQAVVLDYTSRKLYRYDLSDYMHAYGLVALLVVLLIAAVVVIAVQRVRAIHADQEEKVRMLVDHDPLTGAYSMDGFRKKAEELLRLHPDETHIICYINFKSFKYINDSLGRRAGDDLLRFYVAKASEFLAGDGAIGRLEADHFAVLTRLDGDERLLSDEENVLDPTRNYFIDRGKETRVQICGGIYVLVPEDYRNIDIDHMLDLARVAEKRVRDTRKDGCEFYNPEQWEKGKRVADVVSHLPLAIKNGELRVWYQPQVNYVTGDVTGAEALCRWEHGKLGWIRPSEFIPVLEETGLIYDLDCFIWEEVCKDLARWNGQGRRLSVSVNLSRCDIREDDDIPGHFVRLIQKYGLTPDQLRVEVTETAFVEDPGLLISTTEKLRELGIVVEMDDFGSGYSSLHMLKEVPVDRIKLDMHFLTSSGDLEKGRIIVSEMIRLVGLLGMEMIAEGVETKGQADFLREHGCSEMQGYYFFKPMPVESFEKLGKTIECA